MDNSLWEIKKLVKGIPAERLLEIARRDQPKYAQEYIGSGQLSVEKKSDGTKVTPTDREMERVLIDYFKAPPLLQLFSIKGEEGGEQAGEEKPFKIIIDPLDGTSSFIKGKDTWGTMVGLCDSEGRLIYSWAVVSTGEIFQSSDATKSKLPSFDERSITRPLKIDVYDYGAGSAEKFPSAFKQPVEVTSMPSAVSAGWELWNDRLDGLLWLPSNAGKKNYPDYDLVFLDALKQQGWQIILGKTAGASGVEMGVIAPTLEDAQLLWKTGLEIINTGKTYEDVRDLNIS